MKTFRKLTEGQKRKFAELQRLAIDAHAAGESWEAFYQKHWKEFLSRFPVIDILQNLVSDGTIPEFYDRFLPPSAIAGPAPTVQALERAALDGHARGLLPLLSIPGVTTCDKLEATR
jgi:hypothetical protein